MRRDNLREVADRLDAIYPTEVWPEPSAEQIEQLHEFARSIGLPDGSRFHVNGIRHALTLLRTWADEEAVEDPGADAEFFALAETEAGHRIMGGSDFADSMRRQLVEMAEWARGIVEVREWAESVGDES